MALSNQGRQQHKPRPQRMTRERSSGLTCVDWALLIKRVWSMGNSINHCFPMSSFWDPLQAAYWEWNSPLGIKSCAFTQLLRRAGLRSLLCLKGMKSDQQNTGQQVLVWIFLAGFERGIPQSKGMNLLCCSTMVNPEEMRRLWKGLLLAKQFEMPKRGSFEVHYVRLQCCSKLGIIL